ncbi:hypothetical protein E2C01_050202 [Portunus trituberculatus]|uniref:Uncharacterized protein n=1 Tax=Portunus trituberculatus TaxID=210409 RepID=A0A5B7GFF4_PORTR|nr:hypothetical protein [Portunus trituberculatus]
MDVGMCVRPVLRKCQYAMSVHPPALMASDRCPDCNGRTKSHEGQGTDLSFDQQGKAFALTFNPYQESPWKVGP